MEGLRPQLPSCRVTVSWSHPLPQSTAPISQPSPHSCSPQPEGTPRRLAHRSLLPTHLQGSPLLNPPAYSV